MLISYKLGQTNIILRVKLTDSSKFDNTGVPNLIETSTGLNISTIADNEQNCVVYSSGSASIETIVTLGTYAAPTSGKCRFRQVDPNNHSGIYEIQLDNTRYAVSGAKSLLITVKAITGLNVAQSDSLIPLVSHDPYLSQPINFELMDIDSAGFVNLQPTGLDAVFFDGHTATQAIFVTAAMVAGECSGLPASPATFKSLDGTADRAVIAFDADSNRVSTIITPP